MEEIKGKIISFFEDNGGTMNILTDEGKMYYCYHYDRQIKNGKERYKGETDWERGYEWLEIKPVNTREEYIKANELPF